ncbi:MAG: transcriptional repressor [Actinobacteria bacterium]|nr:transcriptional repressor [Actinomycetota bacterium]
MASTARLFERLAERGLRRTPQRAAVLRALDAESCALGAHGVHVRAKDFCPELGLSTVYRTLWALSQAGLVDVIGHHEGEATYRLCGEAHHHHLVCAGCRQVVELEECDLSEIQRSIGVAHDFDVEGHELSFYGRCAACR